MTESIEFSQLLIEARLAQRQAWERNDRTLVETYLGIYPEIAANEDVILDFIYREFCLREEFGEKPDKEEYLRRFPKYAEKISAFLQTHVATREGNENTSHDGISDATLDIAKPSSVKGTSPSTFPLVSVTLENSDAGLAQPLECRETSDQGKVLKEGDLVESFRIHRKLGEGAFANVYAANDITTDRPVALKVLKKHLLEDSELEMLRSEASNAAKLEHKNIVRVWHARVDKNSTSYIALEYVDGISLASLIESQGPLAVSVSLKVAMNVAQALEHAHAKGIYHLDVKPDNILVSANGNAMLTDFGLAIHHHERWDVALRGTPAYLSPEQVQSHGMQYDGRTDLWSLGVVLYEMLTKKKPFTSGLQNSRCTLFQEICEVVPKPPSQWNPKVDRAIDELCLRCLEKNKQDRFGSAAQFLAAAREIENKLRKPTRSRLIQGGDSRTLFDKLHIGLHAVLILGAAILFAIFKLGKPGMVDDLIQILVRLLRSL